MASSAECNSSFTERIRKQWPGKSAARTGTEQPPDGSEGQRVANIRDTLHPIEGLAIRSLPVSNPEESHLEVFKSL